MLNSQLAARAMISAWDNWTDEAEEASDNILQAAVGYAKALLDNAPHQIPDDTRPHFAVAVAVMQHDPLAAMDEPSLSFDEAIEPLRDFVRKA